MLQPVLHSWGLTVEVELGLTSLSMKHQFDREVEAPEGFALAVLRLPSSLDAQLVAYRLSYYTIANGLGRRLPYEVERKASQGYLRP